MRILTGDALAMLRTIQSGSVQTCVTSPPYWGLRDYGVSGQIGLEKTPEEYVEKLVAVFREVRRVLKDDGTLWLNLGDSYAAGKCGRALYGTGVPKAAAKGANGIQRKAPPGLKPKDLVGIPWRVAFALQAAGWYLRSDIIWHKPNPMPESVRDRPTKAHEYVFLLSKSPRYYYDADAIKEPGKLGRSGNTQHKYPNGQQLHRSSTGFLEMRGKVYPKVNRRTVWSITPKPYRGAHFATFPPQLVEPCILAGAPIGGVVLDPFSGAGTTAIVAEQLGRRALAIELNPEYVTLTTERRKAAAAA